MKKLISNFLVKRGFRRLVKLLKSSINEKELNAAETIDFLFSKEGELIRPWQFKEEILGLAQEIGKIKPKVVVEIGTANGGTLFMATRMATPDATIVSIDLPGGKFGGGYPEWKVPIYSSFARKQQQIHLVRADSHLPSTFEQLKKILNGKQIDYLFIDGDHTYEGVKTDFHLYKELVKPGGTIGFHDVVVHEGSSCDVHTFWNEIKPEYAHKEFIKDPETQKKFGVGVITFT